ncbi:cytochrome c oxidase accessory protein CcoG [Halocynthiibacter styelae]|uniref:Cytochrome c oxidase accessory protein CcoG n=1 Tax=Halocynthiibacter styelae TaxID=2761955 RepID=A0A8J7LPZ1_9RHOB|nr:cytochrome c oxidase accessory protein CcoG [Paenihalocynthiibacter styelae]MBI1494321.1 cytochrome c oxidase accessory protein CcoG [Paenihalocynthiibacter styelae]
MSDSQQAPQLYAAREPIFPKRVYGRFRNLKWLIMIVTLGIYYITPWLRWDRGAELPDQAVLIDLASRRFYFFWIEIWPYEFYFIGGLLIMAGLGLFLFTSALGRVWCGYTCPQTVWVDLFILVERWIEGDRNARLRLQRQKKWDLRKLRLRVTKWLTWLLIAVSTGGAWVFYFTDAPQLAVDLLTFNAHPVAWSTILVMTATTFIFGGFMREQVCNYMCPWPRIQAAMMDTDTLTVAYRHWRGEPRGKLRKNEAPDTKGDCIDCMACVNVCPAGIDIRDGQQMECITCALCIDACDEIMDKIGKPRGLIAYMALKDEVSETAGETPVSPWKHIFRLRTMIYTGLWSLIGVGLMFMLFIRSDIDISVAPVRSPVYITMADGSIRNAYDVRLRNKHGEERSFSLLANADEAVLLEVEGSDDGTVTVAADELRTIRVYLTVGEDADAASAALTDMRIWITDEGNGDRAHADTVFNGRG